MGLDIRTAEFLLHAKKLGTDFSNVADLGHQRVFLPLSERWSIGKRLVLSAAGLLPQSVQSLLDLAPAAGILVDF